MVDVLPSASNAPSTKVVIDRFPVREVRGQHPSGTTSTENIQHGIDYGLHLKLRGRPPALAGGMRPTSSAPCSGVRLLGYDGVIALEMLS
jgi:hypothetical protein